jgi:hypothetical protein
MKIKLAIIGLAALLAAGCLEPASKINAIQLGMNKEQVLKIMGTPGSITADTNSVYLNYSLAEGFTSASSPTTPYVIKLVNDKVVFYGREGYPNSPSSVPVPVIVPMVH